ncbi:peptide-methionine (S)-S-oxide reductase MsrA [Ketogulonicigenium vulgare]|uniref:Peptide methionine sulfoxide reductase MsrA n=1 Tax=Ketogulonicigenium vulgare (strain WSH-001) TaxID=759362 RepID=F9Y9I7_KETVW|nr:peptide-methionine (S)-S-oxide reductase MsrA [Ketogulonicigenium vulgare]ADO41946.1 Peptide methionine sulfoxide reductase [Ketogulonicigenium vulgare Y25]AEM40169.1 Peptide methionine sulfoxide reductase [Ketogulonicigenium vulgare WSH-001]ALJ80375.1 methionine sulfoxide reductase A [Ketogulonicigenium vulgare]ANW33209.1 peptide-methionine (S)-S-oxide reductase [Ketogulonicigenium vulgare]AOZ53871.1 Peptide methionine sulfoxide reductase [Ketogulonicigenium vulgare]
MFSLFGAKDVMVAPQDALPGRANAIQTAQTHFVNGSDLHKVPAGMEVAMFGAGCFWGVERLFWELPGVYSTSVGYAGGYTPNPTYEEVCTGLTGHTEVVRIVFDPAKISFDDLMKTFWENHDPTQGMRQGGDKGTQYRSAIYTYSGAQKDAALAAREAYGARLAAAGFGAVTTEVLSVPNYFYAEDYHQQYLAKNPDGYCGIAGTGVTCPIGLGV